MKKIMLATAALIATAGMASAFERPTLLGFGEYSVEAQKTELGAGAEFIVGNGIIVTPMLFAVDEPTDAFDFDRAELSVSYGLNQNVDLYAVVESDSDLNYEETTLGFKVQY